ncbi:MAG: lecithin retinol acyltransferase family protein, partial [Oscillospiraceae bacterium]|nr:lecithin retinol acyltransferase family protein [Oscillospiraceae bacterium]
IFVNEDEIIQFGLPDDPGKPAEQIKVLSTDIETFLGGGELESGIPTAHERRERRRAEDIINTARSRIGEGGYDILHNNCEHFVNCCVFGVHSSPFLDGVREKLRQKLQNLTKSK